MGNRANVIFVAGECVSPCIYLHWNGGPESVYRFLDELDARDVRADGEYEAARFVQIVGEFFSEEGGDSLSLGILNRPSGLGGAISSEYLERIRTDSSDNGFYIVDRTSANGRCVRRFVSDWDAVAEAPLMREMSPAEVIQERQEVYTTQRYAELVDLFATIRSRRNLQDAPR